MKTTTTNESKESKLKGLVLEIQKLSTEDGPGIRTSVFFKGCPLKCDWCHNPESIPSKPGVQWFKVKCIGCKTCVDFCPENTISFNDEGLQINRERCTACGICVRECPGTALQLFGKEWTIQELFHEIQKDKAYYKTSNGGVTVSGGEPFIQIDFITAFLKKCKESGLSTALDTCGYTSQQNIEKILPYTDIILYDLKEIDSAKHERYTGVPNSRILENIKWITKTMKENGKVIWIRTPLIPGYTATVENVRGLSRFIVDELNNEIDRWDLLAFNNLATDKYDRMDWEWKLKETALLKKADMEHFFDIAKEEGVKEVHWSGMTKKEEDN